MPFSEDETVLISAIEHFAYCPRQCALIHVERVFEENVFTLRGRRVHERADQPISTREPGKRVERALPLWSERWGLYGVADTVEFHDEGAVCPVEYKHGPRQASMPDDLQLCAQALCLEEMLGKPVASGAVFHQQTRRRREVAFTPALRKATGEAIAAVRGILESGRLPDPVDDPRCPNCSLLDLCIPRALVTARRSAAATWRRLLSEDREGEGEWLVSF